MPKRHKQIAAIDVGSNSLHLVIAKVSDSGDFQIIEKSKAQVRLGHGGGKFSYLLEQSINDGLKAMKNFARIAREHNVDAIRAVATSAVREAENKDVFVEKVRKESGIEIEVVSGYEESRLIFLGACKALQLYDDKVALCDIGGGSAELIAANNGELIYASSFRIGAIRMTEKFFQNSQVPLSEAIHNCREFVSNEIFEAIDKIKQSGFKKFIGTSGTIQTLANMAIYQAKNISQSKPQENLNKVVIKTDALNLVTNKIIQAGSVSRISQLDGIDTKRADIITAGAITFQTIINALDADEFIVSSYALREGILIDYIEKQLHESSNKTEGYHLGSDRLESILDVGKKYEFLEPHAIQIKNLALMIYDDLSNVHDLPEQARAYLEAAALLHDIGFFISKSSHHKHSLYLIQNSDILGFTENELAIIGNTARYHRKSHPKPDHREYEKLSSKEKNIVSQLASILRIAEALDRSHNQLISHINTKITGNEIIFELTVNHDAVLESQDKKNNLVEQQNYLEQVLHLELWSFERRKGLMEETFGKTVKISF